MTENLLFFYCLLQNLWAVRTNRTYSFAHYFFLLLKTISFVVVFLSCRKTKFSSTFFFILRIKYVAKLLYTNRRGSGFSLSPDLKLNLLHWVYSSVSYPHNKPLSLRKLTSSILVRIVCTNFYHHKVVEMSLRKMLVYIILIIILLLLTAK